MPRKPSKNVGEKITFRLDNELLNDLGQLADYLSEKQGKRCYVSDVIRNALDAFVDRNKHLIDK
jgi:predicted transcriptional regulator